MLTQRRIWLFNEKMVSQIIVQTIVLLLKVIGTIGSLVLLLHVNRTVGSHGLILSCSSTDNHDDKLSDLSHIGPKSATFPCARSLPYLNLLVLAYLIVVFDLTKW